MFTYGSVCSGIEAVSVGWGMFAHPVWLAEIDPFPAALLRYRFPLTPNVGDMTTIPDKIYSGELVAPDVLVGGTPCQAFSVAGRRESLNDDRGNLTLALINILEAIDYVRQQNNQPPCVLVWENVPGVLSTKDNAFGHLLAGLAREDQPLQPPGRKWGNAGYVHSTRTISWRVLDAQYFGVPQRRKRIFLVASAGERSVAEILFERKGLSGDIKPSRETGENATSVIETSIARRGQSSVDNSVIIRDRSETLVYAFQSSYNNVSVTENVTAPILAAQGTTGNKGVYVCHGTQDPIVRKNIAHCLGRNNGGKWFTETSFAQYRDATVAGTLRASGGTLGGGSETLIAGSECVYVCHGTQDPIVSKDIAHCLGRNNGGENVLFEIKGAEAVRVAEQPISPTLKARMGTGGNNVPCVAISGNIIGRPTGGGGNGMGVDESGVCYTLTSADRHAVCWNGDITPKALTDKALTLRASQGGEGGEGIGIAHKGIVRKLTPVECERLQGFPDNWTRIPYRNKPIDQCPDSPRYKAIGNSMAVPVMRWIGGRVNRFLG